MLPEWFFLAVVVVFGLIIGSFLNVVIYRFHTGRSLNDRSHCLSCGKSLHWYELFPVLSYLVLRGRCSKCSSFIPYRYALVEMLTAGAFVLAYLKAGDLVELGLLLTILSFLIIGLVYDLYHMIIPDEVSYTAAALAAMLVGWESYLAGDWRLALDAAIGSAIVFTIFAALWYFSKGRGFGFGDAKLAVSLGALVGLYGISSFIILSFWIGAAVSLTIIAFQYIILNIIHDSPSGRRAPDTFPPVATVLPQTYTLVLSIPFRFVHHFLLRIIRKTTGGKVWGRVSIKSEVPFAPFMVASFVLVYFFNVDVFTFIENIARWIS
ncbi:MAG: prepilin peptidase [Candidatus Paceibacterota bacterium]